MEREHLTIEAMMRIYCRGNHGMREDGGPCKDCEELLAYAHRRLDRCRYQHRKPTCGNCPKHCYGPAMKERMMRVMAYSGPRMTLRHPWYALMHMFDSHRPAPKFDGG